MIFCDCLCAVGEEVADHGDVYLEGEGDFCHAWEGKELAGEVGRVLAHVGWDRAHGAFY